MHGDFRLDNLLIDDGGKVVAVLDWELSTIGHPLCDLAYQCAQWRLPEGRMRGLDGNAASSDALEFDDRTAVIAEAAIAIINGDASDDATLRSQS